MTTLSELLANRKQAINVTSSEPALKVTQNGSGDALRVEDASGDTTPFVIDADCNVGIGDASSVTTFNSSIVVSTSAKNIPLTDNDMSFDLGPTTLPDHRPPAQATTGNQLCQQ